MSRTKELAKSTASILASQVTSTIISVIFLAYFARVFSKEQMAVFAILTMFAVWNELLGGLGMGTLVVKDVAHLTAQGNTEKAKSLISSVIIYRTLAMLLISLIWFFISPVIAENSFKSYNYLGLIRYMSLISFAMSCWSIFTCIQIATQRFHTKAAINVVTMLTQRVLCVIGYFTFGIYGFFTGHLIGTIIGVVLTFFDIRKYLTWRLLPFRDIFKQSKNYIIVGLLNGTLTELDRPVIAIFLGAEALAGYHIAKRLFENMYKAMGAVIVPAGVKFGEVKAETIDSLKTYFRQIIVMTVHLFFPLGFFVMVVGKPLLVLYGGAKYESSAPVLIAFGLTIMGASVWAILREATLRLLLARHLALQTIASVTVTTVAYAILLPRIGVIGIPIAMSLGYFIGFTPLVYLLKKRCDLQVPFSQFYYSTICGLLILAIHLPLFYLSNPFLKLIIASILACIIYVAWLHVVGPKAMDDVVRKIYSRIPIVKKIACIAGLGLRENQ